MSAIDTDPALRASRLRKLFTGVIFGKRAIKNTADAKLFLEAVYDQQERASCIEKLVAAPEGLQAVKMSLRTDMSTAFINDFCAKFLTYVIDDSVKQLCKGQLLQDILTVVVEPPTFWNALKKCFDENALSPSGIFAFACLLLELLSSPQQYTQLDVRNTAEKFLNVRKDLLSSSDHNVRSVVFKIQYIIGNKTSDGQIFSAEKPGGRHDNDFEDFRRIEIFPTTSEFMAKDAPFYLPAHTIHQADPEKRSAMHLDNQFRLLREDMLGELRKDLEMARGRKHGKRMLQRFQGLRFERIDCGTEQKPQPITIGMRCYQGLPKLQNMNQEQRKRFYADQNILKHRSFGCLLSSNEIVAFATVERNDAFLAEDPPIILLQIFGDTAVTETLAALKSPQKELEFVLVDTPFFAYEPILKCLQGMVSLPLSNELLGLDETARISTSPHAPTHIVELIKSNTGCNLRTILNLPKDVILDQSQTESLIAGLCQNVSLIQGPPGTGKSFIGAILAKTLYEYTKETILVICYTNHALDQFLEDILDMNVPDVNMIRLGSKSTERTKSLGLYEQPGHSQRSRGSWNIINKYMDKTNEISAQIENKATAFRDLNATYEAILEYLQFSDNDSHFFHALSTPKNENGMIRIGRRGKAMSGVYLFNRWIKGFDAGPFQQTVAKEYKNVWGMKMVARKECFQRWSNDLFQEQAVMLQDLIHDYSECYKHLVNARDERHVRIIGQKRIIGCTTTGAAKYTKELLSARPGIIIVEEAGEILESHVLTALSPNTKHLVLIGDHLQLRPKVNNYALTVEKGDGFDLNRSLFERLVIGGHPHTVLVKQHRMRPEISVLVRRLMYPKLEDDDKTLNRPRLRGLQSNVVFFSHGHPEKDVSKSTVLQDDVQTSHQNIFEAQMVLRTVRYLAQQGYGTDKQVILTPYLGQLMLLANYLKTDHDPVLNDLDSFDLVRAGLLSPASANAAKRPLKISTIDNYQGEESEIVIVSLTRGNDRGDIGFMAAPQRLNVLLSRARNGLIIIGNANTFTHSRNGGAIWGPFIKQLSEAGQFYDGLPIQCERHPMKKRLLKKKEDFDVECPDGGCSEPCPAMLNCGKHPCPSRCHILSDHSKMQCRRIMQDVCPKGHKFSWECCKTVKSCSKCEIEKMKEEAKLLRDYKLDLRRQEKEKEYAKKLVELDDEIAHERRIQRDHLYELDMERVLRQRKEDLKAARATPQNSNAAATDKSTPPSSTECQEQKATVPVETKPGSSSDASDSKEKLEQKQVKLSQAEEEWAYQKKYEFASNEHLDTLMEMIGLESVKQQVLAIKTKIDTCIRQKADIKSERFGVALLGNPGTGKTTVARIYANFLASVGVLPGTTIKETTGSRLASDGVQKCKSLIEEVLNAGGGAIFIDEAYQLASQSNYGGGQILDFLLSEVENLTGKIVFILAGYNKQMEAFFAHNPGLPSRFPHEFKLQDYDDEELRRIFEFQVNKRFQGRMKAEGGLAGLYCRIVARRVGYSRGREGFGNARAIENAFAKVLSRQATRLVRERRSGDKPDDMFLTKGDLIGPEPGSVLEDNESWEKLQKLIGLNAVKESGRALFDSIQYNYERELNELPLLQMNLNRVFLGSPGTGKTTVAKLYGQILADIGLLSNGEVVVKNPSDFVGAALGASEKTTKEILASTVGKVLVIDEAYGLYGGSNSALKGDPYKTAVIDTIVAEVQSVPGDDRCVLLIGYKDQMEAMFQNVNPGLSRRFPLSEAFEFEDFTDSELYLILRKKLEEQAYKMDNQAEKAAMDVLGRARNRPNFGNAGEVDILLNGAKARHQQRCSAEKVKGNAMLKAVDVDPDFDRGERAAANVRRLFRSVVGCEDIVAQFEGYQNTVINMKARDMDPREQIPFNFLFRGPPGTGKTTTARKMGRIYYDMGFLATTEVVEVSATDLIGEYVGQTGPKTQKLLEKALGRVLFIDEAYRLAEGNFAKEAMDELVDCLTKTAFAQKLVVILAGYDADINRLMSINPGLTSRFPETVTFRNLRPQECLSLLRVQLRGKKHINLQVLECASATFRQDLLERFEILANLPNWANARDVGTLVKDIFGQLLRSANIPSSGPMRLTETSVITSFDSMIAERQNRAKDIIVNLPIRSLPSMQATDTQTHNAPPSIDIKTTTGPQSLQTPPSEEQAIDTVRDDVRDQNVTDEVWNRLQVDKEEAAAREKAYHDLEAEEERLKAEDLRKRRLEREHERKLMKEQKKNSKNSQDTLAEEDITMHLLEQERIRSALERRKRAEELYKIEQERKKRQEERAKEAVVQRKLRRLGVCVAGYSWIKQANGYRCAGGSHFVDNEQLEL